MATNEFAATKSREQVESGTSNRESGVVEYEGSDERARVERVKLIIVEGMVVQVI